MATIITKNSQTSGAVPSAASLSVGELAVNTADGRLFTEHTGGVIKEIGASFPSGTVMLFVQTAAPTGWTKSTTHDNKALRVVSGTASSGGTSSFSTVFQNQTPTINTSGLSAGATTLSTAQMPSHTHTFPYLSGDVTEGIQYGFASSVRNSGGTHASSSTGGGGSHSHSMSGSATSSAVTLAVQYVDVIIATKD
jgi:hypothetical protein